MATNSETHVTSSITADSGPSYGETSTISSKYATSLRLVMLDWYSSILIFFFRRFCWQKARQQLRTNRLANCAKRLSFRARSVLARSARCTWRTPGVTFRKSGTLLSTLSKRRIQRSYDVKCFVCWRLGE